MVIHLGKFIKKPALRLLVGNEEQRPLIWHAQEKKSDVNLATSLVHDAHLDAFDVAAIVTNDSDFTDAIEIVTEGLKKDVVIICPKKPVAVDLRRVATDVKVIYPKLLKKCQFETKLSDGEGVFSKPHKW